MEAPMKFRNHISIVAERMARMLIVLAALLFGSLAQNTPELLKNAQSLSEDQTTFFLTLGGILLIFLLLAGWQVLVWAKTWIYVSDGTLVIERHTLNRRKYTISIQNISNINTEQNLFEMLIGTSKLKLDTNSLSTADKTDVKIVLKTADAEAFRAYLTSLLNFDGSSPAKEQLSPAQPSGELADYGTHADFTDIFMHGLFSINLTSLVVLVICIFGAVTSISEAIQNGFLGSGPVGFLVTFILILGIFFSALWDILKGFIQYYDFRAKRTGDRIFIQYGLLKKASYTIPADKIQALKINQTLLARLSGHYMAEIINVGMGDEESEKNSFLVLYCRKDQLKQKLRELLPEFSDSLDASVSRQPGFVWAVWTAPALLFAISLCAAAWLFPLFLPVQRFWLVLGATGTVFLTALLLVLRYRTAGSAFQKDYIILANGYFGRHLTIASYRHIQHIQLEQSFLAEYGHIQKGNIYLLASGGNQTQNLPYFHEENTAFLRERLLHSKDQSGYTNSINGKRGEKE